MRCLLREHYQWNMDIWGVEGVEAEAELLSAAVAAMRDMGLRSCDVGIKVINQLICRKPITANIHSSYFSI